MERLSRRDFLRVSALSAAATVAAACGVTVTTPTPAPVATPVAAAPTAAPTVAPTQPAPTQPAPTAAPPTAVPSKFKEAPMLAEQVAAGKLPPVDERLPENPFVIEGLDGVGNYGGTWRYAHQGTALRTGHLARGTLRINLDMLIEPYMAESWSVTEDGREYTFHLRKGLKWSDGTPMTSEDFRFFYEDEILNVELTPAPPEFLSSVRGQERIPAEFSAPDDFTVIYKFADPKGLFALQGRVIRDITATPAHYMKQFHKTYADATALAAALKAANKEDWTQLYIEKNDYTMNIDRPVHQPWLLMNTKSDEFVVAWRNPYFWEVDTAGQQLPYIDKWTSRTCATADVALLWALNGELDCQADYISAHANYTALVQSEKQGDYWVLNLEYPPVWCVLFNLTSKDKRLRALFNEKDFRVAMSLAANRDEMREMIEDGLGNNRQYCPPAASPFYYEKLAKAYLDYDPDRANALLDGLGLTERDAEGYRLWNDGSKERVSFIDLMYFSENAGPHDLMLIDYYKAVGIEMIYRGVDRQLSREMIMANEVDVEVHDFDRTLVPLADPVHWIKTGNKNERPWCSAWTLWAMDNNDPNGEKPPEGHWIWDIWAAWEELQRTVGEENQKQVFWKILDIWARELPVVGLYGDRPLQMVVKNGFKGIREGYPYECCSTSYEYIMESATWFWDDPAKHTV